MLGDVAAELFQIEPVDAFRLAYRDNQEVIVRQPGWERHVLDAPVLALLRLMLCQPSHEALGIAVDFRSNNDLTIQGSDLARFYIRSDGLGPATFSFTLGYNSHPNCPATIAVHGQFFVPNGRVNLGDCTNLFGRIWADVIRNDTNINVTYRA